MSIQTPSMTPISGPKPVPEKNPQQKREIANTPRWPHRIACLMTVIVFPLIWVGNLVTTTDAGMAVPDWPNTYGYNLFLYPYREWFFGPWDLFVEHGHRMMAALAGLVAIVLVAVSFRSEPRVWVRWFAVAILGLVLFQGLLGGIRVVLDARWVAKVHGCVGPAFFAFTVGFCVVTSRWWMNRQKGICTNLSDRRLHLIARSATLLLLLSFLQLCFGALIRHVDNTASPDQFLVLIWCHVITAVLLLAGTLYQFAITRNPNLRGSGVLASIHLLSLLVVSQFCLGLFTWILKWGWPVWFENFQVAASFVIPEKSFFQINVVTAHAAMGSLILAFWVVHALRTNRAYHLAKA